MRVSNGNHYYWNGEYIGVVRNKSTERACIVRCEVVESLFGWKVQNIVEYEVVFRAGCILNGWFSDIETDIECVKRFRNKSDAIALKKKREKAKQYDLMS